MSQNSVDKVKDKGQIYTPIPIVNMMLDYAAYTGDYILKKHVVDNSCGNGHILGEVVKRYIDVSLSNLWGSDVRQGLKEYIHGIEYDPVTCEQCKTYLNDILKSYKLEPIEWDIICDNALTVTAYNGKIDFVFGNPPYVRMKNIKKSDKTNDDYRILKRYSFAEKGMSDLYLAFYELGLNMCNETGVLCYIAPSAWINSQSGENMREYITSTKTLSSVIDFEHIQVFDNATTYVMITLFDKHPHSFIRYDKYSEEKNDFYPVYKIPYERLSIDDNFYFVSDEEYDIIKNVYKNEQLYKSVRTKTKPVEVKNGYATLADDIFIDDLPDFKNFTIPIIKGSTGQVKRCLFPYDKNLNLISLNKIKNTDQEVYDYLMEHKDDLEKRTYDHKDDEKHQELWYSIGRSQGLKDTFIKRVGINSLVKTPDDLKLMNVDEGCGIYSGLYILSDFSLEEIEKVLRTDSFVDYVKSLRKYKSGGYYTFSSKDVERYLNYMIEKSGV